MESVTPESLNSAAYEIVEAVCKTRPTALYREPRGVMTFKVVAETAAGDKFMVRFYPPQRAHVVEFEPDILRRAHGLGARVPRVVADSRGRQIGPLAYVVYEMINGVSLADRWSQSERKVLREIVTDVRNNLDILASIHVNGYGPLVTAEQARHESWTEFLRSSFESGISKARSQQMFPVKTLEKLERVQAEVGELEQRGQRGLAWGDVSLDNILVTKDGKLAGLVDFEGVLSGDPVLNVGYAYARYYATGFSAPLFEAFGIPGDADVTRTIYIFAVLRGLRIIQHWSQRLPTGQPRMPITELLPGFIPALDAL